MAKDIASKQFANSITRVQKELVSYILDLKNQDLSRSEILLVLQSIDMEDVVLNKLNLQADIDGLMLEYQSVLRGLEMTGTVTAESLNALVNMDRSTFMKQAGGMGELIKKEVARGIISNATEKDIADGILKGAGGVLRADQAETLANTGLNTFERNVTMEMAQNDPADAKYVYLGIVDGKTRDVCLQMASAGALTRNQIDSTYRGAFADGGGFNCRHRWARETSSSEKLTDMKGAKSIIKAKKSFRPVTARGELVG